jgi:hypothetical protein
MSGHEIFPMSLFSWWFGEFRFLFGVAKIREVLVPVIPDVSHTILLGKSWRF